MPNAKLKQGLRAKEREANKEPLELELVSKKVKIVSKEEPEQWYRVVNRPGYAFSSHKRIGRIVRDDRWMHLEILKKDKGLYGDRYRFSCKGVQDAYRYVNSILENAVMVNGGNGAAVAEKAEKATSKKAAALQKLKALGIPFAETHHGFTAQLCPTRWKSSEGEFRCKGTLEVQFTGQHADAYCDKCRVVGYYAIPELRD